MNGQPLVFISHHSQDVLLAQEFSMLLRKASKNALPTFYASKGIPYGKEWYEVIMGKLRESSAVVALLTRRSLDRPWVLFEAGVAKGIQASVFGVTLGLPLKEAIQGPFAQFQNCRGDESSLTDLVLQLIDEHHLEIKSPRSTVLRAVKDFLVRLQEFDGGEPADTEQDLPARIYEEVKLIGRDLHKHDLAKIIGPRLPQEFPIVSEGGSYDATGWLMLLGTLREGLPWLYEAGLDLHRALITGDPVAIERAREQVLRSLRLVSQNDWVRSLLLEKDRALAFRLPHLLPDLVETYLNQILSPRADQ